MSETSPAPPRLREIALDFLARLRRGERLEVETFLAAHADEAPLLRPLLAALRAPADVPTDAAFEELFAKFVASELDATVGDATAPEAIARFDDRYRVLRTIGRGGFGEVHLVEDELHPGEKLALKTIRVDRAADPHFEQRFRNEIRIMRALQHPGIPQIFNDGKTGDGEFFFTMAYLEGATLEEVLRGGTLPVERTVRLLRQMVAILAYAHAREVIHRDLKPANVFVVAPGGADEQVKILDFGIAKVLRRDGALQAMESMNTIGSPGTPAYMSPEQLLGEEADARVDVYALGVILHRMLSGELPFSGTTPETRLRARLTGTLPPLTREQAPEWLASLVTRLLQPDRDRRPTLTEIEQLLAAHDPASATASARPRRAFVLVAAAVVVAAGIAVALWPRNRDATPKHDETPAPPTHPSEAPAPAPAPAAAALAIAFDPIGGEAAFDPAKPRLTKETSATIAGRVSGLASGAKGVLTIDGKKPVELAADGRFLATVALANEGMNVLRFELTDGGTRTAQGAITYVRDTKPPVVTLTAPASDERPTSDASIELAGRVDDENLATLVLESRAHAEPRKVACAADGSFEIRVDLDVGGNELALVATDRAGNESERLRRSIRRLAAPPRLKRVEPEDGATIARDQKRIRVQVETDREIAFVEIGGEPIAAAGTSFDQEVALPAGDSPALVIRALDRDGQASETRTIRLQPATLRTPPGFEAAAGATAGALGYAKSIVHSASKLELVLVEPPPSGAAAATLAKPFYVGRYEVTREQYEAFCRKSGRTPPPPDAGIGADHAGVPIVSITIDDAEAFCSSLASDGATVRLPMVAEWEYAAGGPDRTPYPWGAEWKPGRCNSGDDASADAQRAVVHSFKELAPIGSFADDRAPCGAFDLAGNVSEWCRDERSGAAVRGGSFLKDAKGCRLGDKGGVIAKRSLSLGFRVVVALDR